MKGPIRYYCISVAMDYHSRPVVCLAECVCVCAGEGMCGREKRREGGFETKQKGLVGDERRKGITM